MKLVRLALRIGEGEGYKILKLVLSRKAPDITFVDASKAEEFHLSFHRDYSIWFTRTDGWKRKLVDRRAEGFNVSGLAPLFFYQPAELDQYPLWDRDDSEGLVFSVDGEKEALEKTIFEVGVMHPSVSKERRTELAEFFGRRQLKLDQPVEVNAVNLDGTAVGGVVPYPFLAFQNHTLYFNLATMNMPLAGLLPGKRAIAAFQPSDLRAISDPLLMNWQTPSFSPERWKEIQETRSTVISFDGPNGKYGLVLT